MALYAVRLNKNWVEFWEADKPPKATRRSIRRWLKHEERSIIMTIVTHEGGEVVGAMPMDSFKEYASYYFYSDVPTVRKSVVALSPKATERVKGFLGVLL